MRKVFAALFSVLAVSTFIQAQTEILPCPTLTLTSPKSVIMPGETMTFSLKVESGIEDSKLKYVWTVSEGYIIEGQNTPTIKVATTPDLSGLPVTAKVTIEGLPNNCTNEASETGLIAAIPACGISYDEYEKISSNEEFSRLDNFFSRLLNNPGAKGYVLILIGENEAIDQAKKRIIKIMKHVKYREFAKERLIFAIRKSDYHSTRLDVLPQNAKFPECNNCEIMKGEDFD